MQSPHSFRKVPFYMSEASAAAISSSGVASRFSALPMRDFASCNSCSAALTDASSTSMLFFSPASHSFKSDWILAMTACTCERVFAAASIRASLSAFMPTQPPLFSPSVLSCSLCSSCSSADSSGFSASSISASCSCNSSIIASELFFCSFF